MSKLILTSQCSSQLSNGKLIHTESLDEYVIPKSEERQTKVICEHQSYCLAKGTTRINCLTGQNNCQSFKFYNRYGENYNGLGMGF